MRALAAVDKALLLLATACGPAAPPPTVATASITRAPPPGPYAFGRVSVTLAPALGRAAVATVEGPVDARALPNDAIGTLEVETLAPFPVRVDADRLVVVPGPVSAPATAWPLVAGERVQVDGRAARVARVTGDRAVVEAL